MKPEIKKLWVDALRSGEYKQGKGSLRNGNKFCCLGVLCNLHAQAHPEIAEKQDNPKYYMGEKGFLPNTVQAWAGIYGAAKDGNRQVKIAGRKRSLATHNDTGRSFLEIADAIEEQL